MRTSEEVSNRRERIHIHVSGLVQGVGFRPFVFRQAARFGLGGFVANDGQGVDIEAEGEATDLSDFVSRITSKPPPLAAVTSVEITRLNALGERDFAIRLSSRGTEVTTRISPDTTICDDCLSELFDPEDRRYRYPFINCTNCGPRYTIVEHIPYDRPLTSMKEFDMCPECSREYHDPANRRFHAQPNACPVCGPRVQLTDASGSVLNVSDPIGTAAALLDAGLVVAVKGLGGFHLAANAKDDTAVRRLRMRKERVEKPFALMTRDIAVVRRYCDVSAEEAAALLDRSRPIVLIKARREQDLAPSVAPGLRELGFMLAYTPLHFLLLDAGPDVLVMTSANMTEEPIAIDNAEALGRLGSIADYFLIHDRGIVERCDDSIVRVVKGSRRLLRRSRGFVPDPVEMPVEAPEPILACGAEQKNTVALVRGQSVYLSQHIGDLDNPEAYRFFREATGHLRSILEVDPKVIVHDLHPEYLSTKWAVRQGGLTPVSVQHHHAHMAAVMAENGITSPTIGIILDGTGYGLDGTIWGGEVLIGDLGRFERFAWLRPFRLPGGAAAVRNPWRTAYGMLHELYGAVPEHLRPAFSRFLSDDATTDIQQVVRRGINSPLTSSCGRLFDGAAALLGLCSEVTYDAQAAIALETAADRRNEESYRLDDTLIRSGPLDWSFILRGVVEDIRRKVPVSETAGRFHRSVGDLFTAAAVGAREQTGISRVGLSGGVFQNELLFTDLEKKLRRVGFEVLSHRLVPTNDGGIAYGQSVVAAQNMRGK